jgi:hypothetical protein
MLPMTPVAVAAPVDRPVEVSPDAPTAVELPVVVAAEPLTELLDSPARDDEQVHVLFAEAATAEIPVQAAA